MGAGSSKPEEASRHIFSSETPAHFSPELVESLQTSSETNFSRAKTLELHIAERVATELSALQKKEDDRLKSLRETVSLDEPSSSSSSPSSSSSDRNFGFFEDPSTSSLTSPPPPPPPPSSSSSSSPTEKHPQPESDVSSSPSSSSSAVFSSLEKLRNDLEGRKKLRDMPSDVSRARDELVQCMRTNDRRPLDCWKEVGEFKKRVGEMEEGFVKGLL